MDGGESILMQLRLADGRRLALRRRTGAESGTVVILHGLLDCAAGWEAIAAQLTCGTIAFDLPGFGASDPPARGSIAGYAADIADGLALLGVTRFSLVGHSLGGAVAAALAERRPGAVAGLVLIAPAGFGRIGLAEVISIPGVRTVAEAMLPFALSSRRTVTAAYMAMISSGHSPEAEIVERVITHGRELVPGAREGTRAVVTAGRARDALYRRALTYGGPVTAVWGDRDRLVPAAHRFGVLVAYPQARIEVWSGVGHDPPRERPGEVVGLIRGAACPAGPEVVAEPLPLRATG